MLSEKQVKEAIKRAGVDVDVETIGLNDNLRDFGLDSLDFWNLFLELEDVGGSRIPDEEVDKVTSISSIIKYYSA